MARRDVAALFDARAGKDLVEPGFEVRGILDGEAGPAVRGDPGPDGDAGNGQAVADEVAGRGLGQVVVDDVVEAASLVGVAMVSERDERKEKKRERKRK